MAFRSRALAILKMVAKSSNSSGVLDVVIVLGLCLGAVVVAAIFLSIKSNTPSGTPNNYIATSTMENYPTKTADFSAEGVLQELNAQRGYHSLPALVQNDVLQAYAEAKAQDMAATENTTLVNSAGKTVQEMVDKNHYNYRTLAWVLTSGQASDASKSLVNSFFQQGDPFSPLYNETGIGVAVRDGKIYVALFLANR